MMKNFDIEQLERKNIYRAPDNFFAGLQENVLEKTVRQTPTIKEPKPGGKIISLKFNWVYAAAAALALLLGLGFFIKNNNSAPENHPVIADNTYKVERSAVEIPSEIQTPLTLAATEAEKPVEVVSEDLTFEAPENPKESKTVKVTEVKTIAKTTVQPKATVTKIEKIKSEDVDQLLTVFTSTELAEISRNAEMDVYLDLYN